MHIAEWKMENKLIKHFIKQQPTDNTQGVLFIRRARPHKRPDDTRTTHTRFANGLRMENLCKLYFIQIRNCALITLIIVICGDGGWARSLDARAINIKKVLQQQQGKILSQRIFVSTIYLHTEGTSNSFFISISLSYASMQQKWSPAIYYGYAWKC